jgi:hypothetical protein
MPSQTQCKKLSQSGKLLLEEGFNDFIKKRVARIELASLAWKAKVLPLHNTRTSQTSDLIEIKA